MTRDTDPTCLPELADALLEFTAPVTQILDHMARAPQSDVDAAVATLRGLLPDVLVSLEREFPPRDLRAAIAVLDRATDSVLDEIHLVPHESGHVNGSD